MKHVLISGEVLASVEGIEVPETHPVYEVLGGKGADEESNRILGSDSTGGLHR